MGFQKGQPRHPDAGRKPGSKNRKSILRVSEVLSEKDINPTEKILGLIKDLEPIDQVKTWLMLLSYCEPKATEVEQTGQPPREQLLERLKDVSSESLHKVIEFQRNRNEES